VVDVLGHEGTRMVSQVYRHAVAPTVEVAAMPTERLLGSHLGPDRGSPPGSPADSNHGKTNSDQG
jgi:hypothetical protein